MGQFMSLIDELLDHRRAQQREGFTFPLSASSLGGGLFEVHARRIALVDRASLKQIPQHLQETVWAGLKELREQSEKRRKAGGQQAQTLVEELAENETALKAARAFAEASFLGLVKGDREEELVGPKLQLALDSVISEEDQLAFFVASTDAESEQAAKLKIFRPRPQIIVEDGPAVHDAAPTIGVVGAQDGGVQQRDLSGF